MYKTRNEETKESYRTRSWHQLVDFHWSSVVDHEIIQTFIFFNICTWTTNRVYISAGEYQRGLVNEEWANWASQPEQQAPLQATDPDVQRPHWPHVKFLYPIFKPCDVFHKWWITRLTRVEHPCLSTSRGSNSFRISMRVGDIKKFSLTLYTQE